MQAASIVVSEVSVKCIRDTNVGRDDHSNSYASSVNRYSFSREKDSGSSGVS